MTPVSRRDFLKSTGVLLVYSQMPPLRGDTPVMSKPDSAFEWIRNTRIVIAEGYNPPFYPAFDCEAGKLVRIVRELGGDALRFPSAAYYAFFPTKSGYPVHPELKGDPMRETMTRCHEQGLKNVVYVPLNHPFMEAASKDPRYAEWCKRFADGRPMTTPHYGFTTYYEGCLNSPVRDVIKAMVREILTDYPTDVLFFDGPYQGMLNARNYCHCKYCEAAYRKRFGRSVPDQSQPIPLAEEIRYTEWMADEVALGFLREIRQLIRETREVPVIFNNTSLLSKRQWRNHGIPIVDGFMFEAAETPEDKLFNMQLGQSTGKVVWTYVGTHTQYNREHLKNERVRGWFTYPVESEELLLDGATAVASGAGLIYWGASRFFYQVRDPGTFPSGQEVRTVFDFQRENDRLLRSLRSRPQVGILVSTQTIDWYAGEHFVGATYENCFHGAYKLLKANSYEAEPFLDWQMSPAVLARYPMLYVPNAACLSDAQCAMLSDYVRDGGHVLATHLTSVADDHGRPRKDFGLASLFGARLVAPEPIEIPDLYLQPIGAPEIPQDPQIVRFEAAGGEVIASTLDRGHRRTLGPAILRHAHGKGGLIYIGSSIEAVYEETRMGCLRDFFDWLVSPWLAKGRSYDVEYRSGVTPHFMAAPDVTVLHLLANTGNKHKHLRAREEYLPVPDVRVRIRIPVGREPRTAELMRARCSVPFAVGDGWVSITVPRVLIHEAIKVEWT